MLGAAKALRTIVDLVNGDSKITEMKIAFITAHDLQQALDSARSLEA